MEYSKMKIYCPKCSRKVGVYDGRSTIKKIYLCTNCNKQVIFSPDTKKIEYRERVKRTCSSGMVLGI